MKGVFFSADFVKASDGEFKLIELNTNTIHLGDFSFFDMTAFDSMLTANNINHLDIIYRTSQLDMANGFKDWAVARGNLTYTMHEQENDDIFAPTVNDSINTFTLRLSYDEAAIFDSEYTATDFNLHKLFNEYNDLDKVVPAYLSGSFGEIDSLGAYASSGDNRLPDYVVKPNAYSRGSLKFIKGGASITGSAEQNIAAIKALHSDGANLITKYTFNSSDLSTNYIRSYRYYGLLYIPQGETQLTQIEFAFGATNASLTLPSDLSSEVNPGLVDNELDQKHYYELATNAVVGDTNVGIVEGEYVVSGSGDMKLISDVAQYDELRSYHISGSPNTDNFDILEAWSVAGSTLPTTELSSSQVLEIQNYNNQRGIATELTFTDDNKVYLASGQHLLTYTPSEDAISFKKASNIISGSKIYKEDLSSIGVTSNKTVILDQGNAMINVNIEDIDTYGVSSNKLIFHNAPCFVAGTQVLTEHGMMNIEDIVQGTTVLTRNDSPERFGELEYKGVDSIMVKENQNTVLYTFSDGTTLEGTHDHPIWVINKNNYASHNPALTLSDSGMNVDQIEVGDRCMKITGNKSIPLIEEVVEVTISSIVEQSTPQTVYNLNSVLDNANFFANRILVHNREELCPFPCCFVAGTEVTLGNGDVKEIQNLVVGDEVMTFNESNEELETKKVLEVFNPERDDLVQYHLDNGTVLECTHDHPHYYKCKNTGEEGLASYDPLKTKLMHKLDREVAGIEEGDLLFDMDGTEIKIIKIVPKDKEVTQTYIMTIEDNHNFFANGILTHNKDDQF